MIQNKNLAIKKAGIKFEIIIKQEDNLIFLEG
jgi:hypothetical protein